MGGLTLQMPRTAAFRRLTGAACALTLAVMTLGCTPVHAEAGAEPQTISLVDLRAKYEIIGASQYIDVDGVNLHYADEGEGQPIVLLPPSFLNFRAWDGVAKALVANNYRVIRPDFPSTGLSGLDGKILEDGKIDFFNRNAEVVAKLVDALGFGKVHVIGTSSGGMAGFRYASYYPDRVERLVLINSAGLPRTRRSDPNRARPEEQKWAKMKVKPPEYWTNVLDRNFFVPDKPPSWLVNIAYDVNRRAEEVDPSVYAFKTGDPEAILADITAPTLILWGKSNPTVVHLDANVFQHWMTGAPTLIQKYDGLGHYPYIENEDLVVSDILAFLQGKMDDDLRQTQRVKVPMP